MVKAPVLERGGNCHSTFPCHTRTKQQRFARARARHALPSVALVRLHVPLSALVDTHLGSSSSAADSPCFLRYCPSQDTQACRQARRARCDGARARAHASHTRKLVPLACAGLRFCSIKVVMAAFQTSGDSIHPLGLRPDCSPHRPRRVHAQHARVCKLEAAS